MQKLGLGVLGLGEGRSIISAGIASAQWDVVCLCDVNEPLCRQRCAEFGLTKFTTSYDELRYSWKIGKQSVIEAFEGQEDYYFRFEGQSHHAGEYQNYIEYFARCLESGRIPKPDVAEGIVTIALLQAMEESTIKGAPVKIADVLAQHGLADLADTT